MSRYFYLVAYDVRNAKRLALIHRVVQAIACGGQKSAFECWLSPSELRRLMQQVAQIKAENDTISFIRLANNTPLFALGVAQTLPSAAAYWG